MQLLFKERSDEHGVLLQKTKAAQVMLCRGSDRQEPSKPVRFQVNGKSTGMYQIKDRTTGKTHAFHDDYKAALELAMQFEAKANRQIAVTR
ncbi:UNVERIFIED_ORG: hypothetical protein OKW15_005612 [Pseudomonas reinekei]|nr:hypothetical protein [Pseudomonas reinekei]